MKKFLNQCLLFGLIFVSLFSLFNILLISTRKTFLTLPSNVNKIFLGNSMIECDINDELLNYSLNFARRTEPINYAFAKLKLLHKLNPQLDTVILGIDDVILYNDGMGYKGKHALYFMDQFDLSDWRANITHTPIGYTIDFLDNQYDFLYIKPMLVSFFADVPLKDLDLGGHLKLQRDDLERDIEMRETKPLNNRTVENFPSYNKYYLDKIVQYCLKNNLHLSFMKTPQHPAARKDTAYREIHKKYYSQIYLADYLDLDLEDSLYSDCLHLNSKGSDLFTRLLKR